MSEARYERFGDLVWRWPSVETFVTESGWRDGIHVVSFGAGGHVDILLRGEVAAWEDPRALPVFFTGAVTRDGTSPPFFSGTTMARRLECPVVAIADPTLTLSEHLTIGWYTGAAEGGFQHVLSRLLRSLRSGLGRDLVLVGGSAGGFAALLCASATGSGAFVWNPQVDLLRYSAWAVRDYLGAMFGTPEWSYPPDLPLRDVDPIDRHRARRLLDSAGIASVVGPAVSLPRLIYLQNSTDHHLQRHAQPFVTANRLTRVGEGMFSRGQRFVSIQDFAHGHRPPDRPIIESGLALALAPTPLTVAALDKLSELSRQPSAPPGS